MRSVAIVTLAATIALAAGGCVTTPRPADPGTAAAFALTPDQQSDNRL